MRAADKIYWADSQTGLIQRADLDGSNVETLYSGQTPTGLSVDPGKGELYWTETTRIRKGSMDGSAVASDFLTGLTPAPQYPVVANLDRVLCWYGNTGEGSIFCADLDAVSPVAAPVTEDIDIDAGGGTVFGLAVDQLNQQIYWTVENTFSSVQRVRIDGTDRERAFGLPLLGGGTLPRQLAVDGAGAKVYYVAGAFASIYRDNVNGGDQELLFNSARANAIFPDTVAGKLFWSTTNNPAAIQSDSIDGGVNPPIVLANLGSVPGLYVDNKPSCSASISSLVYESGSLTLNLFLGTATPALLKLGFEIYANSVAGPPTPVGAFDPQSISVPIPNFPSFGEVGVLVTLVTSDGVACADFGTVDTGAPVARPNSAEMQGLSQRLRTLRVR